LTVERGSGDQENTAVMPVAWYICYSVGDISGASEETGPRKIEHHGPVPLRVRHNRPVVRVQRPAAADRIADLLFDCAGGQSRAIVDESPGAPGIVVVQRRMNLQARTTGPPPPLLVLTVAHRLPLA
jgi:hypothetical protein